LSFLTYGLFSLVVGNPVKDYTQFFIALLLGSLGFAITFTFVSAISAKANNSATLMAVLSFPIIIPIIMTLVKISANALRLLNDTSIGKDMLILVSIDIILVSMAFILFPYLWKD
jgi:heme exporter protein B